METITACYSFDWLIDVKIKEKKYSKKIPAGMKEIYQAIVRCAYGKNFTWVTIAGIAQKTGRHPVTVWRNIKKLVVAGLIAKGFNEDIQKEGFYLLPHPELVAHMIKKGIKFVISKLGSVVAGDEKQYQDEAVENQKGCEIEAQKNCILQSKICEMQSPLYRRIENELPPSPPKGDDPGQGACMTESEVQKEGFSGFDNRKENNDLIADYSEQDNKQLSPVVSTVLTDIGQERAHIPLVALVKSSIIYVDDEKIKIKTGKYSLKIIRRHLPLLEDAFHRHGITEVSLSVMSEDEEKQHSEKLLARERQESVKKQQQAWCAALQAEIAESQRIASLPDKEQFRLLAASYPSPENGYTDTRAWDIWPAWKSYIAMRKTGEIPPIFDMLRVLKEQKLSKDWNRDNGRWIPGLFKWLNSRPWVNVNASYELQTRIY